MGLLVADVIHEPQLRRGVRGSATNQKNDKEQTAVRMDQGAVSSENAQRRASKRFQGQSCNCIFNPKKKTSENFDPVSFAQMDMITWRASVPAMGSDVSIMLSARSTPTSRGSRCCVRERCVRVCVCCVCVCCVCVVCVYVSGSVGDVWGRIDSGTELTDARQTDRNRTRARART